VGGDGCVSHLARCTTAAATEAESPRPAERGSDGMTVIPGRARGLRSGQTTECWSSEPEHLEEGALGGDGDDVHRNIALPAADRGHERGAEGGCSRLAPPRRGKGADHALLDAYGEASLGLPPTLVHASAGRPHRGEPCGRGWCPGHLAPRSLPLRSTRVRLRSPAQDLWRGIRESLPREADRDRLEDRTECLSV
jgi:hypothetical protein